MQTKLPRPSRLALRFNHWALRRGFPLLLRIAPVLPRWLLLFGARIVIAVVMFFNHRPKRAIARNLARILGAPAGSLRVRAARRQMLRNFGHAWADLFRFAQLPPERALELVDRVVGHEHLERERAAGRGALLLTAHLGPWELGGVFMRALGVPLSIVYVPDQYADVEGARQLLRRTTGVEEIAVRPGERFASLPVLRALREGRAVALQGDRDFNARGLPTSLLGGEVPLPPGPFHLALATGAAVLPVFLAYSSGHRFTVEMGAPLAVQATGDREGDVRRALAAWARVLEGAVKRWPTQWFTFYDFWPGTEEAEGAGAAAASR